jgi:tRNA nucleotidyltransferase (CCA-adding enzyme)
MLYLMTLLSTLDRDDRKKALERLSPPPRSKQVILRSMEQSAEILSRLPLNDPAELYHLLIDIDLEIILFSMASTKDTGKKKEISQFLVELRKAKPMLRGSDLKKMGIGEGPVYSEILRALLDERLRGHLRTAEDEKTYVRRHFDRYLPKGG